MTLLSWRLKQLLKYYADAETLATVHSPLAYHVMDHMLNSNGPLEKESAIELKRKQLKNSTQPIERIDYGAGSDSNLGKQTVRIIASKSLSSPKKCKELSRLAQLSDSKNILEIGSSFGIMTAYLAASNPNTVVTSLEGDPGLVNIAERIMLELDIRNVNIVTGKFANTLPKYLEKLEYIEFAFLDGNHTYDATMQYFNDLKPYITSSTVLIIDDIYWSPGMNKAWKEILNYGKVTLAIDRFDYGLLFFETSVKQKTTLKVIDQKYKPWKRVI